MNNINLPTSGSRNWGRGLNNYLENLCHRLEKLEAINNSANASYKEIVGYAGSGMIGDWDITYNNTTNSLTLKGSFFVSGENPYYKTFDTKVFENVNAPSASPSVPGYVFLKADRDDSRLLIEVKTAFKDVNYNHILLGFIYKNSTSGSKTVFIPYYYSSGKTLIQHQYELQNRWADLDKQKCSLSIQVNNKIPSVSFDKPYLIYCGGLCKSNIRLSSLNEIGSTKVLSSNSLVYYEDSTSLKPERKLAISGPDISEGASYRVLLDIFGNIITQKAYSKTRLNDSNNYWSEQQLLNTYFCDIEDFLPGLYVEILRFGYNGDSIISTITYTQNNTSQGFSGFHVVKSIIAGNASQLADNVYLQQNSTIWLESVNFKNNKEQSHNLNFEYNGADYAKTQNIVFDGKQGTVGTESYFNTSSLTDTATKPAYYTYTSNVDTYNYLRRFLVPKSESYETYIKYAEYERSEDTYVRTDKKVKIEKETEENEIFLESPDSGSPVYISYAVTSFNNDYWEVVLSVDGDSTISEANKPYVFYDILRTTQLWIHDAHFDDSFNDVFSIQTTKTYSQRNVASIDFSTAIEKDKSVFLWDQTETDKPIQLKTSKNYMIASDSLQFEITKSFAAKSETMTLEPSKSITVKSEAMTLESSKAFTAKSETMTLLPSNSLSFSINGRELKGSADGWNFKSDKIDFKPLTSDNSIFTITNEQIKCEKPLVLTGDNYIQVDSDRRLKENINLINMSCLDAIKAVNIYDFNYLGSNTPCVGLVAQELKDVLSLPYKNIFIKELQTPQYENQLAVLETKLVYILWKALQEETAKREVLEEKINSLLGE